MGQQPVAAARGRTLVCGCASAHVSLAYMRHSAREPYALPKLTRSTILLDRKQSRVRHAPEADMLRLVTIRAIFVLEDLLC